MYTGGQENIQPAGGGTRGRRHRDGVRRAALHSLLCFISGLESQSSLDNPVITHSELAKSQATVDCEGAYSQIASFVEREHWNHKQSVRPDPKSQVSCQNRATNHVRLPVGKPWGSIDRRRAAAAPAMPAPSPDPVNTSNLSTKSLEVTSKSTAQVAFLHADGLT